MYYVRARNLEGNRFTVIIHAMNAQGARRWFREVYSNEWIITAVIKS